MLMTKSQAVSALTEEMMLRIAALLPERPARLLPRPSGLEVMLHDQRFNLPDKQSDN